MNPHFIASDYPTEELWEQRRVLTAFCDAQGILLLEFLNHEASVNAHHYCTIL
jgi:hypothetical protein